MERLWRSLKCERVYLRVYDSVSHARNDIAEYFDFYNNRQPHSRIDNATPEEKFFGWLPALAKAA